MKDEKNRIIKVPLIITQEEIAILLGVTRSQWAMYESGQRGLSSKSKSKLEIVLFNANKLILLCLCVPKKKRYYQRFA
jgi:DNA-binding transcriptional regulator YiaG